MEKPSFAGVSVFDVPFTLDKIYSYEINYNTTSNKKYITFYILFIKYIIQAHEQY